MRYAVLWLACASAWAQITPKSIWRPGPKFQKAVRQACDRFDNPKYGECFVEQMQHAGASSEAVAFAKSIDNTGYIRDLKIAGKVAAASVIYPFRANENPGWLFVNGQPDRIDPDGMDYANAQAIQGDRDFAAIAAKNPKADLWPSDRNASPASAQSSDGSSSFLVEYRVQDGCHACAMLGFVYFAYDFDASGTFQKARFLKFSKNRVHPELHHP